MNKKTIAVVFGGQSSEHDVSCMSVLNIIKNIDTDTYEPLLIGITKDGRWLYVDDEKYIADGTWRESDISAEISPDASKHCVILTSPDGEVDDVEIDVAWPALHGMYGEDGTIQGLFELAGIPYVGCGVLASAVSMDKLYTKIIVNSLGIRQAEYVGIRKSDIKCENCRKKIIDKCEEKLGFPVFVKPASGGSSCGASKASTREELSEAIDEAFKFDNKILVEECINGREVECAVIGNNDEGIEASRVGEVLADGGFYTYDAKYNNPVSNTDINPVIDEELVEEIRESAKRIFGAVDGFGLSRVDFFLKDGREVVFNEINTMPGFTGISMYPKLMEQAGVDGKTLVNRLIEMAYRR
ncbi:MAG: D-alanine--D-alanine ligase family protein [Eubacteriales bacterium]|nr:D-alanine--D-alanine ligase family protein [Eubacteriales bacterium]